MRKIKKDTFFIIGILLFTGLFSVSIWAYEHLTRPDFSLTGTNGATVTLADIRAKPAAVFFGYTMCPDVCPTTLVDMSRWLEELGPDADKINVWFFTVDPARDTPERLHDYISSVSDRITGLSGDQAQVDEAIRFFRVTAEKVDSGDGDYTYDHTAAVILTNKMGLPFDSIPYQSGDDIALEKLRSLVKSVD